MVPVVLLTDFGLHDSYVGQMKGAMLGVNPRLQIVDLMHELPAYGIEVAAYILAYTYTVFPKGSVFVCVVDPGVGTRRAAIAVKADGYYFVGPDNGIFSVIVLKTNDHKIREIKNGSFWRKKVSSTFHGRDIFGPTGAHIATSPKSFDRVGPLCRKMVELPHKLPEVKDDLIDGRIIHIDRFGNMLTNIESRYIPQDAVIHVGDRRIDHIASTYGEIGTGKTAGIRDSLGLLEIAIRERSCAEVMDAEIGQKIRVVRKK